MNKRLYVIKTTDYYLLDDQLSLVDTHEKCGLFEWDEANEIAAKKEAEGNNHFIVVPADESYQKPKNYGFQYDENHFIDIAAFSERHAITRLGPILVHLGLVASFGAETKGGLN